MKKYISFILALLFICFGLCSSVSAITVQNSTTYYVNDAIVNYNYDTKVATISANGSLKGFTDYPKYTYDEQAFSGMLNVKNQYIKYEIADEVETLVLSEGITELEPFCLTGLKNVSKVVLPKTLKTIGKFAFALSKNLKEVSSDSVEEIKGGAFMLCVGLKSANFPNLKLLNDNKCVALDNFDSSYRIDDFISYEFNVGAFQRCTNLENVNIGETDNIGAKTFYDCVKLKNINNNNRLYNVQTVGGSAFYNCRSLKKIGLGVQKLVTEKCLIKDENYIYKRIYYQYEGTFANCISLEEVHIRGAESIGPNSFYNCKNLKTIDVSSLSQLGAGAFAKCSSLEKISLPKVKNLSMNKWAEYSLKKYNPFGSEKEYNINIGNYYDQDGIIGIDNLGYRTYGAFEGCTKLKEISIPNVTSVGARSFYSCTNLKKIEIPKVRTLGASAFYNCKSLTTAKLPKVSVLLNTKWTDFYTGKNYYRGNFENCSNLQNLTTKSIDEIAINSFKNCKKLKKVDLCCNLISIGNDAFRNCISMKAITIPEKVKTIGKYSFYNAKNLKSITINSSKLTTVGSGAFTKIYSKATFKVPKSKLKKYKKMIKKSSPKNTKIIGM